MTLISIKDLECRRGGRLALRCPALAIEAGQRWEIAGANGSGKTTLLKVIAGLLPPSGGALELRLPPADIVYVHQHPYFFRGSVLQNLSYGLKARRRARPQELLLESLRRFGLEDHARRPARKLSGGEGRKLALARALILDPPLLLLDEPTAELDEHGALQIQQAIEGYQGTLLIASPTALPAGLTRQRLELLPPEDQNPG